jgi:hypothetical protein
MLRCSDIPQYRDTFKYHPSERRTFPKRRFVDSSIIQTEARISSLENLIHSKPFDLISPMCNSNSNVTDASLSQRRKALLSITSTDVGMPIIRNPQSAIRNPQTHSLKYPRYSRYSRYSPTPNTQHPTPNPIQISQKAVSCTDGTHLPSSFKPTLHSQHFSIHYTKITSRRSPAKPNRIQKSLKQPIWNQTSTSLRAQTTNTSSRSRHRRIEQ